MYNLEKSQVFSCFFPLEKPEQTNFDLLIFQGSNLRNKCCYTVPHNNQETRAGLFIYQIYVQSTNDTLSEFIKKTFDTGSISTLCLYYFIIIIFDSVDKRSITWNDDWTSDDLSVRAHGKFDIFKCITLYSWLLQNFMVFHRDVQTELSMSNNKDRYLS